ncbi:MAG TPA: endonuclease/exonuclease/phosphatase family protein [Sphingomicrobium sp.]|nr:endonuclease/exonuclease/phosphatase family protein [Sphingomicrobium sp.]
MDQVYPIAVEKRSTSLLFLIVILLTGCARHPPIAPLPQAARQVPAIFVDHNRVATTEISVVTYNVAGLPFPARTGTGSAMRRIHLAMTRAWQGDRRPDILLLQEAFVPSATRLILSAGLANHVRGPSPGDRRAVAVRDPEQNNLKGRKWRKGEGWPKLANSGLALGTNFGILAHVAEPFGRRSCAGLDCLANKGVTLTALHLPGVPEPLLVLNTHLNARGAARVSRRRTDYAHRQQVCEMAELLAREWRGRYPLIYAGDFNTRGTARRFDYKDENLPGELAHRFCHNEPQRCRVEMSWDGDEPWRDTQDLQGYASSARVTIEPVAIEAEFDEPVGGRRLSDHDALRVTFRMSWRVDEAR